MRKTFCLFLAAAGCSAGGFCTSAAERPFSELLPANFDRKISSGDFGRHFYPSFSDREAWQKVSAPRLQKQLAEQIVRDAEVVLSEPIPESLYSDYIAYKRSGNRTDFESGYFRRRDNLGRLVLALCLTGDKDRYFLPVMNYLWAITGERYWCMHAHANYRKGDALPIDELTRVNVDLFSAQTAALVALSLDILGDEIRAFSPQTYEIIRQETLKRTTDSFLDPKHDGMHWWLSGSGNWPIWISRNLLITGIVLEKDSEKLAQLIRKLNSVVERYYSHSPADGFCEEGPGYWSKSNAEFFEYLDRLEHVMPGSMNALFTEPKVRAMMEFAPKAAVTDVYSLNFGDGGSRLQYNAALLYAAGRRIESSLMMDFGRARLEQFAKAPYVPLKPFDRVHKVRMHMMNGDFLMVALRFLFDVPPEIEMENVKTVRSNVCYPGRLVILRAGAFIATLKAGHNGELHNHNDLGHFTLFYDDKPVIIDLGTNIYTKDTFSAKRYESIFHNGFGHNAPVLDEIPQSDGREFSSTLEWDGKSAAWTDLTQAYPREAGIQRCVRTLSVSPEVCTITDEITGPKQGTITLFAPGKAIVENNVIRFESGVILTLQNGMKAEAADFGCTDANICASWGNVISKIRIDFADGKPVLKFSAPEN